ncbi:hypothetical protein GCM10022256_17340 [Frondihabitans peucedani]|uniref:Uncharacterized protein n=1 Tax=Frondihabitans peucedani TaxID=598626 RepID=A0ABP8E1M5_9MICO
MQVTVPLFVRTRFTYVLPAAPPPALGEIAAERCADVQAVIAEPVEGLADVDVVGEDDVWSVGDGLVTGAVVVFGVDAGVLAVPLVVEQPARPAAVRQAAAMSVIFVVVRMVPSLPPAGELSRSVRGVTSGGASPLLQEDTGPRRRSSPS